MASPVRILIAEDDFAISLALKTILQANFQCQLSLAKNGEHAWQQLQQTPVDLVVSDWNMPEKSGKQLLADIRNDSKLKNLPFLMLTARADKESVIQAVKLGVSGYIHKPFNRADLIAKIKGLLNQLEQPVAAAANTPSHPNIDTETTETKRDVVNQIVNRLKREQFELPVLSNIADTVKKMLQEQDANIAAIAEIIGKDPVITAKILALANSALYRGNKTYKTLAEAIARIGMPETQKYLWVLSNQGVYQTKTPLFHDILSACHIHTIACAECCRLLAIHIQHPKPDECYFLGLIHDIGVLLVTRILEDIAAVNGIDNRAAVLAAVRQLHCEFGGVLLTRWGMDSRFQELVRHHEDPQQAMRYGQDLQLLYVANQIVNSLGYSLDGSHSDIGQILATEPAMALGIDAALQETLGNQLSVHVSEIQAVLNR